ncbi:MAG: type IV secretion system DNA-binding domain-containing protein [Candidatus Pacebacteria bacterium]|nr:type IV secretion system DNA-binding domain-containing protein [Candidatus Paceibacterota bacterium]MBP9851345.1 type IV secretion system DNA-binding domain-containing protein [Candidatus Paceibacterota bacterium]
MAIPGLPENRDITYIGYSTYRDQNQLFGIKRKDRRQHMYILGKSGTGKSGLMTNMVYQNIMNGEGVGVVDPHGELVETILSSIPPERIKDVVYFNPSDTDFHIGFNVLEIENPEHKHLVASGLMGIFTKIWANAWSARMEYILNNTILALLDTPGTTLLGVTRMLVDKDYRQMIIGNLKDPVIKAFWVHEYEAWQDKFRNEAIAPIQNKVGQFLSTFVIRNIVGQSKSTINIFDLMNQGKILLVNVSKGRIGEDNSRLIGGMLITKIQLAAMERVRIPEDERRDFYLYVDEFQNFVTDSFASILSEARKYRLSLTVAHQYTAQLVTRESSSMRDSIFGNIGTMIIFRTGAEDTKYLEKEFDPEFTPGDIVNLPNFKIYLKLMVDGMTSRPFSAKTMPPLIKTVNKEIEQAVIESSRALYCRNREEVEADIVEWSGTVAASEGGTGTSKSGGAGSGGDKFKAQCSVCGNETFVPFEPQPGRPVYCKDCIAKIKAGELKPLKNESDTAKNKAIYYKPLADLGIEFEPERREESRPPRPHPDRPNQAHDTRRTDIPVDNRPHKPGVFGNLKKIFNKDERVKKQYEAGQKTSLKSALATALQTGAITEEVKVEPEKVAPISLSALKPIEKPVSNPSDRSAGEDKMNALKNLIDKTQVEPTNPQPAFVKDFSEAKPEPQPIKVEPVKAPEPVKVEPPKVELPKIEPKPTLVKDDTQVTETDPTPIPPPVPKPPEPPKAPPVSETPKEVPEDVLRKILNGDE